jgi:hypothetical protein
MSLSQRLKTSVGNYTNTDSLWVQYVKDHRSYLLNLSNKIDIDSITMFNYRYRPEDFLAYKGYSKRVSWIILWLNQIYSHTDFVDLKYIFIPELSIIENLYATYKNYKSVISR